MTPRLLTYRCGTFPTFLKAMTDAIRANRPSWNVSPDHFLGGYLASWAEVCDILTFYQERIAREGYLDTAEEDCSVRWLARQVGYQPAPGLSATVPVSFRFTGVRARGSKGQVVPQGSVLQSIPANGGPAVQFETVADLEAIPSADAIALHRDVAMPNPALAAGAVCLRVNGNVQVEVGQMLLLVGAASDPEVAGQLWFYGPITAVQPDPLQAARLVRWSGGISGPLAARETTAIEAYIFGGRARVFGFRARPWKVVPDAVRNPIGHRVGGVLVSADNGQSWTTSNQALPAGQWHAIVASGEILLAGGAAGVYRSVSGGPWAATPLRGRAILSLAASPSGDLLAGSVGGALYRSVDGGETWNTLPAVLPSKRHWWIFRTPPVPFPQTGVRALLAHSHGGNVTYCAGTDSGFFTSADGLTWQPASQGLPGWNEHSGQSQTAIFGLTAETKTAEIYAATQHGLFHAAHPGASWRLLGPHLGPKESVLHRLFHRHAATEQPPPVSCVAVTTDVSGAPVVLVGTAAGICVQPHGESPGRPWQPGIRKHCLSCLPRLFWQGPANGYSLPGTQGSLGKNCPKRFALFPSKPPPLP